MTKKEFIGGLLVGTAVSFGLWFIVRNLIEAKIAAGSEELRKRIDTQVPPLVQEAIQEKLDAVGLTPQVGRNLTRLLG